MRLGPFQQSADPVPEDGRQVGTDLGTPGSGNGA